MSAPRRSAGRLDEPGAVRIFLRAFGGQHRPGVQLGIGDDAAVLSRPRARLVWTVDAAVEGTHFERSFLSLEDIGYRAFQAAASDLAAMGARPLAALAALTLPRKFSADELERLSAGQAEAARRSGCPIVGGNVARGKQLSITTGVLGTVRRPLLRSGARAGHEVWLVGDVGLAALGLELLRRSATRRRPDPASERALLAFRRPKALLERGQQLVGVARSAVDVSDGLALDAARVAEASGCRVVLEERALRRALPRALGVVAERLGRDPLAVALSGGEDYALVVTGPAALRPRFAKRVGRCERGSGGFLERADGSREPLGGGYDHFAR